METLDGHCHFWSLSRGDYDWLQGQGGPLEPLRRDFLPTDYPDPQPSLIVVQAAPSLAETDFLLNLARGNAQIAGVVGWVDLASDTAAGTIAKLAQDPRFKGVRPMLQDIADTDWLLRVPHPDAIDALVRYGLRFDALVTPRHLGVLAQFADANPDLAIVIDHAAKPHSVHAAAWAEWETGMAHLAGDRRIHCKLSGLLTELTTDELADPLAALRERFDRLLDWFGPNRLIWGSDWPVLTLAAGYNEWRDLTDDLLSGLSAADRAAIMGRNARRFYGVDA